MSEPYGAPDEPDTPAGRAADCASVPRGEYERAFYGDGDVLTPESVDEMFDVVREAHSRRKVLIPEGAGSHAYLGVPPEEEAVVRRDEKKAADHFGFRNISAVRLHSPTSSSFWL